MRSARENGILITGFCLGLFSGFSTSYFVISESPQSQIVRWSFPDIEMRKAIDTSKPIARAGEWVTDPQGKHVCQLRDDLYNGMVMNLNLCGDWQIPIPHETEMVPFLRWSPQGGSQILVEGQWRP